MGNKYKVRTFGKKLYRELIEDGDIIELEELEEPKEETLAQKFDSHFWKRQEELKSYFMQWKEFEEISRNHFRQHPEEVFTGGLSTFENLCKVRGMVSIDEVLDVIEKQKNSWTMQRSNEYNLYLFIRKSIEGMKK